jgi:carbamoyl-phosphate synthase large subunit
MNVQFAVKDERVYLLEVNPRASRTTPFVSKATGVPLARPGARVMAGQTLDELGVPDEVIPPYFSVKEPVFPFNRFQGIDIVLGPEMQSTGEVMGIDDDFGIAFAKALMSAGLKMPYDGGTVFVSVREADRPAVVHVGHALEALGYHILATSGTCATLRAAGIQAEVVRKIHEGRPNVLDLITDGKIALVVNTPSGRGPRTDEGRIRAATVQHGVPCITTLSGAAAALNAVQRIRERGYGVKALQDYVQQPVEAAGSS